MNLQSEHFADFFRAVHKHDPYPWQQALVDRLAETDTWPDVLELPTSSGKTAALDAAVFHYALSLLWTVGSWWMMPMAEQRKFRMRYNIV